MFWKEGFTGDGGKGGFFVRNDLPDFMGKVEAQGFKIVGIRIDSHFQLELLVLEE